MNVLFSLSLIVVIILVLVVLKGLITVGTAEQIAK